MSKSSSNNASSRKGRPPAEEIGLANERVLTAATELFLDLGFGRTTLDMVAKQGRVGKSVLYRRYPNKEALFEAVVHRSIKTMFDHMTDVSKLDDQHSKLQVAGEQLIEGILHPRCVALMRITAAEAKSLPALAQKAYQVSFDGSVDYVLNALGKGRTDEKALLAARRFVELAVQPFSFQAAFDVRTDDLRRRASSTTSEVLNLLIASGYLST